MTRHLIMISAACALLLSSNIPAPAQSQAAGQVIYKLEKETLYQHGCFAPCDCPIWEFSNARGTFRLTHLGFDGLYDNYAVTDVNWVIDQDGTRIRIKGEGTYRVGGEFAITQQLSVDLTVGSDPVAHFDSGVVAGSDFPRIDLTISIHGGYCFDTVIDVRSRPAMQIAVSNTDLSWDPVPSTAGYDVVRGDLRALRASRGDFTLSTRECVAAGMPATSLFFTDDPAPGEGFWFLARWVGGNGDTYDEDDPAQIGSSDAAIQAAPTSCP